MKLSLWHLLPWHEGRLLSAKGRPFWPASCLGRGTKGGKLPNFRCTSSWQAASRRLEAHMWENGSRQIPFGGVARAQGHGVTRNLRRADGRTGSTEGLREAVGQVGHGFWSCWRFHKSGLEAWHLIAWHDLKHTAGTAAKLSLKVNECDRDNRCNSLQSPCIG